MGKGDRDQGAIGGQVVMLDRDPVGKIHVSVC